MNRLIMVGSPRAYGRSAALADLLFEACIEECPDDELALAPVSTLDIKPCQGCDACKKLALQASDAERAADAEAPRRCVIDDDMAEVYEFLDVADEVVVVCPVYFAGAPAQFKALLDRLQPYFWTDARLQAKRPATLHVVGEGGDPHGFDPLVGVVRSALSCAGFALERVLNWVGKINEEGEITAEATEYPVASVGQAAAEMAEGAAVAVYETDAPATSKRPSLQLDAQSKPAPQSFPHNAPAKGKGQGQARSSAAAGSSRGASKRPKTGSGKQGSGKPGSGKQGHAKQNGKRRG